MGTQRIDGAAVVEEQATAVRVFADAVTVLERIKVLLDEIIHGEAQMSGQRHDLILGHIDGPRFACTTSTATQTLKTDAGVKKIGALFQRVQGDLTHGSTLSEQ